MSLDIKVYQNSLENKLAKEKNPFLKNKPRIINLQDIEKIK